MIPSSIPGPRCCVCRAEELQLGHGDVFVSPSTLAEEALIGPGLRCQDRLRIVIALHVPIVEAIAKLLTSRACRMLQPVTSVFLIRLVVVRVFEVDRLPSCTAGRGKKRSQ